MTDRCSVNTTLSTTIEIVINKTNKINIKSKINMELATINDWLKTNTLSTNINKCQYMIFHTFRKKANNVKTKMNNTIINRVNEFNFLNLTIDETLTWNNHINKVANKISKGIRILNKLKHFLPLNAKVIIYNSLILSDLNFCILAWGYK